MRYMPVIALLIVVVILLTAFFAYSNYSPHPTPIATPTPTAKPIPTVTPTPTSIPTANLTASLVVGEYPVTYTGGQAFLNLDGSVTNVGNSTAYDAGLHVVAYDAQRVLQINATIPLAFEEEFTNPYGNRQSGTNLIGGSHSVTSLTGGQAFQIRLNIYHSGTVTNWTVTPVWTNTP